MSVAPPGAAPWPCLHPGGEGRCRLDVVVTPNAPRTGADGLHDGALRVRLQALPVDGRANDALTAWLSQALRLPRRAVRLLRGPAARRKQIEIDLPLAAVAAWLAALGLEPSDRVVAAGGPHTRRP